MFVYLFIYLLASERSERDTYRGKNEKIGDVYLLASERSERDTFRGNTTENRGCLFISMYGRTYVILYFDPRVFLCSLRVRPRPKLH